MARPTNRKTTTFKICGLVAILLAAAPSSGSDDGCLRERGRIPLGAIGAISADPPSLRYGSGTALVIDDVLDPTSPRRLGDLDLRSPILDLVTQGRITYAGTQEGLHIIDTHNPRRPRHLAFVATEHSAQGVAVYGWRAWVVGPFGDDFFQSGSSLIHVGRPEDPWVISSGLSVSCGSRDVELQYPLLFFIGCDLEIFDLSKSSHIPISRLDIGGGSIAVDGTTAAITDGDRIRLIDLSDPSDPVAKGEIWTHGTARGVALSGGLVVGSSATGLTIADITSLDVPHELSHSAFQGGATSIAGVDGLVYAANGGNLRIVSIDDPTAPTEISTTGEPQFGRVSAFGRLAVATSGWYDITVIDIGRLVPTAMGGWSSNYGASEVGLLGTTAFVTADGGLYALDVTDPTDPKELSFIDLIESEHLAIDSGRAYIATTGAAGFSDFDVVDVANPTEMDRVGGLRWGRGSLVLTGVDAVDDIAVLMDSRGLRIVDVSDARHPTEIGYWEREGGTSVAVVGDIAVLGFSSHDSQKTMGIDLIDLDHPGGPTAVATWTSPSTVTAIAEYGERVLVGTSSDGVFLFDLRAPSNPQPMDSWSINHLYTRDLAVDWPLIVHSTGSLGLTVLGLDRRCMPPRRPSSRQASSGEAPRIRPALWTTTPSPPLESAAE